MYTRSLIVAVTLLLSQSLVLAGETVDFGARLDETRDGLKVMRVLPKGWIDQFGLREGDVIEKVNGQPIRTVADLTKTVQEKELTLEYTRNGRREVNRYRVYAPVEKTTKPSSSWEKPYVLAPEVQRKPVIIKLPKK